MRVLQALKHLQLIVDHLLVALDILFEDDLDRNLALRAIRLAHDSVCAGAERFAETVFGSVVGSFSKEQSVVGAVSRTFCRSCRADRAAC